MYQAYIIIQTWGVFFVLLFVFSKRYYSQSNRYLLS